MPSPGGGTPLYKSYRYMPPRRVGFLLLFGLKTGIHFVHFGLESGIHFVHFGLESGMVFGELRECMKVFIVSIPNE